jgi:hypothetical protein
MIKKMVFMVLTLVLMSLLATVVFAQDSTHAGDEKAIDQTFIEFEPFINRTSSVYVGAGGDDIIQGDNNLFTENVRVTNMSNATIGLIACASDGTYLGSSGSLASGRSVTFNIPWNAGRYYFVVFFVDTGFSGNITLELMTTS